jgi:hypothetical protein
MGASMGRLTPIQVGVMAIMESLFWCIMFAINTVKNVKLN